MYNLTGEFNGRPYYIPATTTGSPSWYIFYSTYGWYKYIRSNKLTSGSASAWNVFSNTAFPQSDSQLRCQCESEGSTDHGGAGTCACPGNQLPINGRCGYCPTSSYFDTTSSTCSACAASDCTSKCGRALVGGTCECAAGFMGNFAGATCVGAP